MKEIIAYTMCNNEITIVPFEIVCVPFQKKYWKEYMRIYNDCFHEMRKDLEIEPFNFYSDYSQIENKINDTFLLIENDTIVGSISCCGNEIDDLIVNKSFQRNGYGKKLLLWGMSRIKKHGYNEIILHVAEWNEHAIRLYLSLGFKIKKKERVR